MTSLFWQVGSDTDIGGGRENQDDYLVFQRPQQGIIVLCVFDGHGREVGKIAANAARASLLKFCDESLQELVDNPTAWLVKAHDNAHLYIKESFRKELESQGFEVTEDEKGGYLLKRKSSTQSWTCIHGGSSCSIVAIIGHNMYIGNVGDSSGLLCSSSSVLNNSLINYMADAGIDSHSSLIPLRGSTNSQYLDQIKNTNILTNTLIVTAEHSPESPYEFYRLREYRHREDDPLQPSLLVVYDSPSQEKSRCFPVFTLDENGNGKATVTNQGK
jgi:hypothetical protein